MRAPVNSQSRALLIVAILAGHGLLIYIMATSRSAQRPDAANEFHSLPIYLMPFVEEEPRPARRTPPVAPRPEAPPARVQSAPISVAAPQQAPATEQSPSPAVDWAIAGVVAARKAAQEKSGPIAFGDQPEEEPPPDKPDGVFEKKSPRKAGYIEEIAPGVTRKWMSEKCYMEFGHLPPLFAGQGPAVNPLQCIQSGEPRSDLFDHLKPRYLKRK